MEYFRKGFFSAVVGHLLPMPQGLLRMSGAGGKIARAAFAGIAGGITTQLGGGKFANGAWTAAFVRLFNVDGRSSADKIFSGLIKISRALSQSPADGIDAMSPEQFQAWYKVQYGVEISTAAIKYEKFRIATHYRSQDTLRAANGIAELMSGASTEVADTLVTGFAFKMFKAMGVSDDMVRGLEALDDLRAAEDYYDAYRQSNKDK